MPVDLDAYAVPRGLDHKPLICFVGFQFGVERNPYLAALFADGWDQDVPGQAADGLRFLHPAHVHAFKRLDVGRVVFQANEREFRAVGPADGGLGDVVEPQQPQRFDLVAQQLVDGILDAGLVLTGAQHADGLFDALNQQRPGNAPRLGAASPAVQHFVTAGSKQPLQLDRKLRVGSRLVSLLGGCQGLRLIHRGS